MPVRDLSMGRKTMKRRTTLVLASMALLGLGIAAFPRVCFAQAVYPSGIWQLNLAKSTYNPGPAPKSQTVDIQGTKATVVGIGAGGDPVVIVFADISGDGKPHPVTGSPAFDADTLTRVDAYTASVSRSKAGKVVQTGTGVVARDGKTVTVTISPTRVDERSTTFKSMKSSKVI
jgi:hypothetical protein